MLSDREQRVLDDLERNYDAEVASPPPQSGPRLRRGRWRHGRNGRHPSRAFVAGMGAVAAGWGGLQLLSPATGALAIAVATGLGWVIWRFWPTPKTTNQGAGRRGVKASPREGRPQHRRTRVRQARPRPSEPTVEAE